jgi:molybdate transport system permease protein
LFLALPIFALFLSGTLEAMLRGLSNPLVLPALRLSLITSVTSVVLIVALGTPLAFLLSQSKSRALAHLETLIALPAVIPPAVAGVTLLLALGQRGLLGGVLSSLFGPIPFTTTAVICAATFVAAPFYVLAALGAFRRVDPRLFAVARTLGASPFRLLATVAVPLALPGLTRGMTLSWARALGEFGATLMFAGNLEGTTQTLPLAIYVAFESDWETALALSLILVLFAIAALVLVRKLFGATDPSS